MARISMKGPGSVAEISAILKQRIPECGWTCEMVDSVQRNGTELIIFEKHYYRAGNFLTLSLLVSSEGERVIVDSLSSGARQGFLDITWGAEEDFALEPFDILEPMGFEIIERKGDYEGAEQADNPPEPVDINELIINGMDAARGNKSEKSEDLRISHTEPERVKLGREEKKSFFGRKRNKPDWEY